MKIWQKIVLLLWVTMLSSAVVAVEKVTYIHTDALGSPMAGSDANGDLVWKEDYRPYGEPIRKQSKNQKLWYTGKEYDDDIGLSYYGARWYDPAIGRFMGVDPVEVDPENIHLFNRYAYANNNPYRYVDPDGNSPLEWGFIAGDVVSLGVNIGIGNYGAAAWDVVNIGLDIFAPPGVSQASHVLKGAVLAGKATKRTVSKIDDITKPGSKLPNIKTDVSKSEFEKNLLNNGFAKSTSKDGSVNIFSSGNKKFTTRGFSKSTDGPTAEVFRNNRPISKIRLGDE